MNSSRLEGQELMQRSRESAQVTQDGTAPFAHAPIAAAVEQAESKLNEFEAGVDEAQVRLNDIQKQ